jgi:hypothetical protein
MTQVKTKPKARTTPTRQAKPPKRERFTAAERRRLFPTPPTPAQMRRIKGITKIMREDAVILLEFIDDDWNLDPPDLAIAVSIKIMALADRVPELLSIFD